MNTLYRREDIIVLNLKDFLLASLVALIWGFNFIAIKSGLSNLPPFLFCALRFVVSLVPAIFFVSKEKLRWKEILAIGFFLGVVQFGFLYMSMYLGMPANLASVLLQSQVIFTCVLARYLLKETINNTQKLGIGIGLLGIVCFSVEIFKNIPIISFVFIMISALGLSFANISMKKVRSKKFLNLMVWSSLVPIIPLFILSLIFESPNGMFISQYQNLMQINFDGMWSLIYTGIISTLLAFTIWGYLLQKYSAQLVTPFTLLVPGFGIVFAYWFFGEELNIAKFIAFLLVVTGLSITTIGASRRQPKASE